jgi:guanylate kinase
MSDAAKKFEPFLFCLCGPSGVGKSTISRELLKRDPELELSISATTRTPRIGEIEGVHYHFFSKEKFEMDIQSSTFLEWATYNNEYYGTPNSNYLEASQKKVDLLLDIDVQGAEKLKGLLGRKVKVIFVAPPTKDSLRERLVGRGSDSEEAVQKRLKRAEVEFEILSGPSLSDYKVVNDGLEKAVQEIQEILKKERLAR